jgi:hypothetical protein
MRYAKKIKTAEAKLYKDSHFNIYFGDGSERVIADRIDFLKRKVTLTN